MIAFDLWPHQGRGCLEVLERIDAGERRICLQSPTGGGKTRMAMWLIRHFLDQGRRVAFYTNRNLLLSQVASNFTAMSIPFGVRAAAKEWVDAWEPDAPVQLCSSPTIRSRVYQQKRWTLPPADLVIFDELHIQKENTYLTIQEDHLASGAVFIGLSATPLGVNAMADSLVQAGSNSECRATGSLVPAMVYACDELQAELVTKLKTGETKQNTGKDGNFTASYLKSIWTQRIYGSVFEHWRRLNPDQRPTVLFAPGVKESLGFAQEFQSRGIPAAHIDGNLCWKLGKDYGNNIDARNSALEQLADGRIKVLCNRYVCREGIDVPELYHCILATPIGSLTSYLQTVGRVLRKHPSVDHVQIQDHGGNYLRHGSPNLDRDWSEIWRLAPRVVSEMRIEDLRGDTFTDPKEREPLVCPKCGQVRAGGPKCPGCGFQHQTSVRTVIQADGELAQVEGEQFQPRKVIQKPNTAHIWTQCYWRCHNSNRTFRQAEGLFFYENHYWPPRNLRLMPKHPRHWFCKVKEVSKADLIGGVKK